MELWQLDVTGGVLLDDGSELKAVTIDEHFFPHGRDFRGRRPHQVRLQGGDASSDSYCYR